MATDKRAAAVARWSISAAATTPLTPGAISGTSLERSGALRGYHAEVDPHAVGRGFQVLVWVNLATGTRETIEAFERALAGIDDVIEAQRLYGDPDYLLRVAVVDSAAYEELYTTRLAALPGVDKARSQMAMKTVKRSAALPVD